MSSKTWKGSCHCGAVAFEVDGSAEELSQVLACNCSMCGRSGAWMVFVPEGRFRLLQGQEALKDYQFGKEHIHHPFCTRCGLKPFSHGVDPQSGAEVFSVNVRCLPDVELQELEPSWYDGRAL